MSLINRISTLYLTILCLFIMTGCLLKNDSTIYNPVFEKNETYGILEISKIVFTDTATVLYFDAYHCTAPECWFSLAKKAVLKGSKKTYNLIAHEGIEFDKKIHVPESGHLPFVFYFEPVDQSEKMLDFVEGDENGGWRITGIKLYDEPQSTKAIKCTLKGEVIDRPQSNRLLLLKQNEDPRIQGIEIPIIHGKFEYILNCKHEELYELYFIDEIERGSARPISFISERGVIDFTLYPMDRFSENKIKGGKLTDEYWNYLTPILNKYDAVDKEFLTKSKQYLEDNFSVVFNKQKILQDDLKEKVIQLSNNGVDVELAIQAITEMEQSIYQEANHEIRRLNLQYIKEHPTIVGYTVLVSEANTIVSHNRAFQETNDISPYVNLYQTVFAPKFPNHPYTEKMEILFAGSAIKAGVPFIDFTAVDMTGKPVKLSDRITGKPAVLHLWASWCGPCRKHGKELIPVYEEFRDKGFVVIGVAREKTISSAEEAIKSDKYPWENLVELNDTEQIWNKYGVGNGGGAIFLIDEKGIIVAVNPTIDDIRDFLINVKWR